MHDVLERALRVRLLIFDVDGVLTDGRLYFSDEGHEYKAFHSRDGQGMKALQSTGVQIGIITGRTSQVVTRRMADLGVVHVYQGCHAKQEALAQLLAATGCSATEAAYVGDDAPDLAVMRRVGLAIAVQDADPLVKAHCHWVTPSPGGRGAARDACDLIMKAQGTLEGVLKPYLELDDTR